MKDKDLDQVIAFAIRKEAEAYGLYRTCSQLTTTPALEAMFLCQPTWVFALFCVGKQKANWDVKRRYKDGQMGMQGLWAYL